MVTTINHFKNETTITEQQEQNFNKQEREQEKHVMQQKNHGDTDNNN